MTTDITNPKHLKEPDRPWWRSRWCLLVGAFLASGCLAVLVGLASYLVMGPTTADSWYNRYLILYVAMALFCVAIFIVYRDELEAHPDFAFFLLMLTLTVGGSLLFDVNQVSWDQGNHFGHTLNWIGSFEPHVLDGAEYRLRYMNFNEHHTNLAELAEYRQWLDAATYPSDKVATFSWGNLFQRLSSLPSFLVYWPLRMLGVSFSWAYVLSKLPSALIYSLLCYRAMREVKSGKMIVAAVAMIPTALFLAENYSYDFWLNGFTLWAVAAVVGAMQRSQPVTARTMAKILVLFVLGLLVKAVYAPLALIALLIPRRRFTSEKGAVWARVAVVLVTLGILATFAVPMMVGGAGEGDVRGGSDVNAAEQVFYVLADFPHYIFGVLLPFMLDYLNPVHCGEYLGQYAYLGIAPAPFYLVSFALLIFTCVTDHSEEDAAICTWKSRTVTGVVCWVCLCLAASALYVSFTPVGSSTIAGFQFRYIIPVLFPMLIFYGLPNVGARVRARAPRYNVWVLALLTAVPLLETWALYVSLVG